MNQEDYKLSILSDLKGHGTIYKTLMYGDGRCVKPELQGFKESATFLNTSKNLEIIIKTILDERQRPKFEVLFKQREGAWSEAEHNATNNLAAPRNILITKIFEHIYFVGDEIQFWLTYSETEYSNDRMKGSSVPITGKPMAKFKMGYSTMDSNLNLKELIRKYRQWAIDDNYNQFEYVEYMPTESSIRQLKRALNKSTLSKTQKEDIIDIFVHAPLGKEKSSMEHIVEELDALMDE